MSENGSSNFEQSWGESRAVANSTDMQVQRMEEKLGIQDPPASIPVPQIAEPPKGPEAPSRSPTSDSTAALADAPATVGKALVGGVQVATDMISAGADMVTHPQQALAGVAGVLSNINNFALDSAYKFDAWMRGNNLTKADLEEKPHTDYASLIADAPQTDEQKTARQAGKFVAQIFTMVAGGAVAAPLGVGAQVMAAGASNMLAFDPHDEGLSDMVQKNPDLRNRFTEWWSVKPEDSEGELRFKNFLAGAFGEGLGIAVLKGLEMYKARNALKAINEQAGMVNATASASGGEIKAPQMPEPPKAPLASENTLQSAEKNAGTPPPGGGNEAPPTPEKSRGPVVARNIQLESRVPRQFATDENRKLFAEKVNTNKYRYFGMAENVADQVNPTSFKPKSQTWQKSADEAINLLLDPEKKAALRATTLLDPDVDQAKIFAAGIERDFQFEEADKAWVQVNNLRKSGAPADAIEAAESEAIALDDEMAVWAGIVENKGSRAGQGLNAVAGVNQTQNADRYRQYMVDRDLKVKAMGSTEGRSAYAAQRAEGMAAQAAGDPKFVKWSDKLKGALSKMLQGNKITDIVQSVYVEAKLANPFTFSALNIGSQFLQIANAVDSHVWTNRAAKLFGKSEAVLDAKKLAEAFKVGVNDVSKIPVKQVDAYRKFLNYQALQPEAARMIEGQAIVAFKAELKGDLYKLHGLASDAKFTSGAQSKFGSVARTHTMEELTAMDPDQRIAVLLGHAKKEVNLPFLGKRDIPLPSQIMATGDAVMGNMAARTYHDAIAMRYALSQGESNPLLIQKYYKEAMNDPPVWMRQQVIDAMDRANFTTEITKDTNPILYHAKNLFNSHPISRQLVPFQTVAINGVSQALEHTPFAPLVSKRTRDALAAGGLMRDQAMGKIMMGTEAIALGGTLFGAGLITGKMPRDAGAREAFLNDNPNFREDAIHPPGTDIYVPMRLLEGPGRVLKYGAYMAQFLPHLDGENSVREWQDFIMAGGAIAGEQMSPDFLIEENGKITSFLKDPTGPEGKKWLAQKLSSPFIVEAGRFTKNLVDPERRKIDADMTDGGSDVFEMAVNNFKNAYPFLSSDLVPYRNMWGDTVEYSLPLTGPNNTSPIAYTRSKDRSVENEVVRLGMSNPFFKDDKPEGDKFLTLQMPRKSLQDEGIIVDLNPKQYDDYVRLSAGDYQPLAEAGLMSNEKADKYSRGNLRQEMAKLIASPTYQKLPDKYKKEDIRQMVKEYRADAKDWMFKLHPDLSERQAIESYRQDKASLPKGDPRGLLIDQKIQR
jgi:hypothetical protein